VDKEELRPRQVTITSTKWTLLMMMMTMDPVGEGPSAPWDDLTSGINVKRQL